MRLGRVERYVPRAAIGLLVGIVCSQAPTPAAAQTRDACANQQTTKDIRECAAIEYQAADSALKVMMLPVKPFAAAVLIIRPSVVE